MQFALKVRRKGRRWNLEFEFRNLPFVCWVAKGERRRNWRTLAGAGDEDPVIIEWQGLEVGRSQILPLLTLATLAL